MTLEHWPAVGAICVSIIVAAVGGLGFVSVQLGARISELSRHLGARLDTLERGVRSFAPRSSMRRPASDNPTFTVTPVCGSPRMGFG